MSSTILYLAIVAIWAGVLVPRWLRREPHQETSAHPQDVAAEGAASGTTAVAEEEGRPERGGDHGWAQRSGRARVMAARRRLFGILVTLAVAATTIAAAGLATWWVVAPPVVMLAGYVLLLREAARADAELAARGAASAAGRAGRAGRTGHRQAGARPGAGSATPDADRVSSAVADPATETANTAEVVDLTSRVEEELYDQYADAKLRAVGD